MERNFRRDGGGERQRDRELVVPLIVEDVKINLRDVGENRGKNRLEPPGLWRRYCWIFHISD